MSRSTFAGVLLLLLAACTQRTPPPAPAPLPPPPPPPVAEEPAAEERARTAWREATALGRQGRWTEAEQRLREATRLDSTEATYHLALANALIQIGHHSPAADALLAAIRLEEARPSPNHRVLVVDYDRAIELLERVNRLDEARTARARQEAHRRERDRS